MWSPVELFHCFDRQQSAVQQDIRIRTVSQLIDERIQLGLAFGRCQVKYTIVNGVMNIIYFHDDYNFDWKEWGDRSRTAEILTRMGSYIPGTDFETKYKPNIEAYE